MADLGILLTDALALKAYQGTKTVTRRPMVPGCEHDPSPGRTWRDCLCRLIDPSDTPCFVCDSRYGPAVIRGAGTARVGGRTWVREAWAPCTPQGRLRGSIAGIGDGAYTVAYRADGWGWDAPNVGPWRPSVHMPRWASRTWGRIVSVRPCDLTDIDHAEAVREGFDSVPECLAGIRAIYPTAPMFWRVEWERIEVPNG